MNDTPDPSLPPTRPLSVRPAPPEAWTPLVRLAAWTARPVDKFLHVEASSGIVLLVAAALALAWANSPWRDSYAHLWHTPIGVHVGAFHFERSLEWVINDGLMVIFFFVVGMEIRREIHCGELSEWRRALLPAVAALGGMIAPALIYLLCADAPATHSGWGVSMATDIAFAVGILALLGNRVPPALRVLLLALAVIDDLGAIIVIAVFYSSGVQVAGFAIAALGVAAVFVLQKFGVRSKVIYLLPGLVTWGGTYYAGVHPTIAGVVIGLCTPVLAWLGKEGFAHELGEVVRADAIAGNTATSKGALRHLSEAQREAVSPVDALVEMLHPWVAYFIMPLFALANAGVALEGLALSGDTGRVALGVLLGLVVGKPVGVLLACSLTLSLGLAKLPRGLTRRHLLVLGVVAGVGFTMALFVAQLAFADASLLSAAKLGVLAASGLAGVLSIGLGLWLLKPLESGLGAQTAHEAETSTEF